MKRITMFVSALVMVAVCAVADTKETVTIHGAAVNKQATRIVFDGDDVTLTFSDGTCQTAAMESVNVAFDYVATFGSDAEENLRSIKTFGGKSVAANVSRSFQAGKWATICLPFNMSATEIASVFGQGTQVAAFTRSEDQTLYFTSTDAIAAGVPYLISPAQEVSQVEVESALIASMAEGSTVSTDDYSIVGLFADGQPKGKVYYLATDGQLKLLSYGTIPPLRSYISGIGEDQTLLKGDVNGDGAVSVVDVMMVVSYVIGSLDTIVFQRADLNGDGSIDVTDVMSIVWVILHTAEDTSGDIRVYIDDVDSGIGFGGKGDAQDADANASLFDNNF